MDPFSKLKVDPALACEFLAVFARCEYALKEIPDFAQGHEGEVRPAWDLFAKTIATRFEASESALANAVNYLTAKPPKKQVLRDGKVEWRDVPYNEKLLPVQNLLLMVRRVRNNLFHGGKFLDIESGEEDRDQLLVQHSLTVLRECIQLEERVAAQYEN